MKLIRLAMLGIIAGGTLCRGVSTMAAPAYIPSKPDAAARSSLLLVGLRHQALPRRPLLPSGLITGPAATVTSGGSGRLYMPIR